MSSVFGVHAGPYARAFQDVPEVTEHLGRRLELEAMMEVDRNERLLEQRERCAGGQVGLAEAREGDATHPHRLFESGDRIVAVVPDRCGH